MGSKMLFPSSDYSTIQSVCPVHVPYPSVDYLNWPAVLRVRRRICGATSTRSNLDVAVWKITAQVGNQIITFKIEYAHPIDLLRKTRSQA